MRPHPHTHPHTHIHPLTWLPCVFSQTCMLSRTLSHKVSLLSAEGKVVQLIELLRGQTVMPHILTPSHFYTSSHPHTSTLHTASHPHTFTLCMSSHPHISISFLSQTTYFSTRILRGLSLLSDVNNSHVNPFLPPSLRTAADIAQRLQALRLQLASHPSPILTAVGQSSGTLSLVNMLQHHALNKQVSWPHPPVSKSAGHTHLFMPANQKFWFWGLYVVRCIDAVQWKQKLMV